MCFIRDAAVPLYSTHSWINVLHRGIYILQQEEETAS